MSNRKLLELQARTRVAHCRRTNPTIYRMIDGRLVPEEYNEKEKRIMQEQNEQHERMREVVGAAICRSWEREALHTLQGDPRPRA